MAEASFAACDPPPSGNAEVGMDGGGEAGSPAAAGKGAEAGASSGRKLNGAGACDALLAVVGASATAPPAVAGRVRRFGSAGWAKADGGEGVVGIAPDSTRVAEDGPKPTVVPGKPGWAGSRKYSGDSSGGVAAVLGGATPPTLASEAGTDLNSASLAGEKPDVGDT